MSPVEDLRIDDTFVSRLLLGALSEHEQRRLAVRLLAIDDAFRLQLRAVVAPFEMFDLDLVSRYAEVLQRHRRGAGDDRAEPAELTDARLAILAEAYRRGPDLDAQIRAFTFGDVLELGEVTRSLFTWSMAEHLLARGRDPEQSHYNARTSLYLALMVIDVVDILGAAGHSPHFPAVVAEVRGRIRDAQRQHGS